MEQKNKKSTVKMKEREMEEKQMTKEISHPKSIRSKDRLVLLN